MRKNAVYKAEKELMTYVVLYYAAGDLIKKTEQIAKGSGYTAMSALILAAFTFEAYLNHLGEAKIKYWREVERTGVMGKYAILCDHLNMDTDFSRRPHQTIKELFRFRNALAHGKTEKLEIKRKVRWQHDNEAPPLRAAWEEYCTPKNARRARDDVSKAIRELHGAAGLGDAPFVHGIKEFSVRLLADETAGR